MNPMHSIRSIKSINFPQRGLSEDHFASAALSAANREGRRHPCPPHGRVADQCAGECCLLPYAGTLSNWAQQSACSCSSCSMCTRTIRAVAVAGTATGVGGVMLTIVAADAAGTGIAGAAASPTRMVLPPPTWNEWPTSQAVWQMWK